MSKKAGKKTGKQIALSKSRLRKKCCSEQWVDDCCYHSAVYPPKSDTTPMIQCDYCLIHYPAYYIHETPRRNRCEECYLYQLPKYILNQLPSASTIWRG